MPFLQSMCFIGLLAILPGNLCVDGVILTHGVIFFGGGFQCRWRERKNPSYCPGLRESIRESIQEAPSGTSDAHGVGTVAMV
jgi:hypothetical protein